MTNPIMVIGAGPAGLMAAEIIADAGHAVIIYDAMPSPGRKFLMAGRGGLNLTYSEPLDRFLGRYGSARPTLAPMIERFSPTALRAWSAELGIPTFVGSSGRVFPQGFKASALLRAWLRRLESVGVRLHLRHRWLGWDANGAVVLVGPDGSETAHKPAALVLALGGASWPRLGSDGGWAAVMQDHGIVVKPFRPSNSGFDCNWSAELLARAEGQPLKRISVSFAGRTVPGELVLTRHGLEGGALYALSAPIRDTILREGQAEIKLDLKPDLTLGQVASRLARASPSDSFANRLRKTLSLGPPTNVLLRELAGSADLSRHLVVANLIKALPLTLTGVQGLDRAISTAGGIALDEIEPTLMLTKMPGVFCCGEMLDWEAPTGGYLLQACFATGVAAGQGVVDWLKSTHPVT